MVGSSGEQQGLVKIRKPRHQLGKTGSSEILPLTSRRPYGLPSFFSKTVLCNAASNLGFAASSVKGMAALETPRGKDFSESPGGACSLELTLII